MNIRPYIENIDYEYWEKWIDNERIHSLWCANIIPYPITKGNFHNLFWSISYLISCRHQTILEYHQF